MEKKSKKHLILGITSLLLVTLLLLGLTYAYYRTRIIGNQSEGPSIDVESKKLEVTYQNESALVEAFDVEPSDEFVKTFEVKNTGDERVNLSITIDSLKNNFRRDDGWTYVLYYINNEEEQKISEGLLPRFNTYIKSDLLIEPEEVQKFKFVLKYENLNVDQSEDMGASLSLRLNIADESKALEKEVTAAELLASAQNGVITLKNNVILTNNFVVPSEITEIDLNNYSLTLKGAIDYNRANPIIVKDTTLKIKNGLITRYLSSDDAYSLIHGSMIYVDDTTNNTNLTLENVVLDGKEIEAYHVAADATGGIQYRSNGLYIVKANNVEINNCILKNNYSTGDADGGAIYSVGAKNINVVNTHFVDNYSTRRGAAIAVSGSDNVYIKNSIVENNDFSSVGTVSIIDTEYFEFDKDSIVRNNTTIEAGGIRVAESNALISGTIEKNVTINSDGNGGGLYIQSSYNDLNVTIDNTAKIINNIAGGAGGGIYVNSEKDATTTEVGNVILNGALISGNVAKGTPVSGTLKDGGGAGIYVARGKMTINAGTIQNNTSTSGKGDAILVSNAGGKANGGKLEINGGTILGSIDVAENYGTLTINGGTYSFDVSNYLSSGLSVTVSDGKYIVG